MVHHWSKTWSARRIVFLGVGLILALSVLAVELAVLAPELSSHWHSFDYGNYVEMGRALGSGANPYGEHRYYPLPTALWIFLPLSLMPDWFRLVWVLVPLVFIIIIHRTDGLWFLLFPPLWFAIGDGMLDGWLLLPLFWLLTNRPGWAGAGGALLLLKPQLALPLVIYRVGEWLVRRDIKNLRAFIALLGILFIPSFLADPNWIAQMLAVLPGRVNQSLELGSQLTVSVWAWWYASDPLRFGFILILVAIAFGVWRGWQVPRARAALLEIVNLLFMIVIFASSLILLIPTVRGRKPILALVGMSWITYALSNFLGFAGAWALLPLAALYLQKRPADIAWQPWRNHSLARLTTLARTAATSGIHLFHWDR